MDFFSGKQPDLISAQTMKELTNTLQPSGKQKIKFVHWTDGLSGFYQKFIEQNIFAIVILIIVCIFLFIRYLMKKDRIKKEKFTNFNPSKKLKNQKNYNYYVPNDVPILHNNKLTTYHDKHPYIEEDTEMIIVDDIKDDDTLTEELEHNVGPSQSDFEERIGFYGDVSGTSRKSIDELAKMMFN
jgi:hypothetical protein